MCSQAPRNQETGTLLFHKLYTDCALPSNNISCWKQQRSVTKLATTANTNGYSVLNLQA
jgi:hypothetical protein